ncbi:MAG: thermostable dipeptidase [Bacillati bacterium ANGP1]|uniref:Thermostable dipeptidase n=1 Tax=Candidatus Segetimicrobium genomatis TaxID=2569760 RepID=A0A537LHP0_9BACT|nr:MAG: thermostable dipeptidase [Terrabacteria group bacterium ANGP1]
MSPLDVTSVHRRLTAVDGHCDLPLAVSRATDVRGTVPALASMPVGRAIRDGGVRVVVSPTWVELEHTPEGLRRALVAYARLEQSVAQCAEEFAIVTTGAQLRRAVEINRTALVLGLEGCSPLGYDPHLLDVFARLGARVVALTWNERNAFASGAKQDAREGLSPLGKVLVREGDRLGVIWDVSHLNERSFWDLLETSTGPIVASHSNCQALFTQGRNLTDEQIRAIARRGGIVSLMIQSFVMSPKIATMDEFLRHVDHAVSLAGVDHVGFGYDFTTFIDGLDLMKLDYLPPDAPPEENMHKTVKGIATHAELPRLTEALLAHGFNERDTGRVMGGNWFEFLATALK